MVDVLNIPLCMVVEALQLLLQWQLLSGICSQTACSGAGCTAYLACELLWSMSTQGNLPRLLSQDMDTAQLPPSLL